MFLIIFGVFVYI